jgi:tripartite-type tricarboxylate transporter receptor subunit TctC
MSHVPYRGGGLALTGLMGGQVQILFSTLTQMLPNIQEGRVRGLAVTSATRSKLAPDIPTMVESGFDQFVVTSITAIVAPPGTPIDIRRRLNQAVEGRSPPRKSSGRYRERVARHGRHRRRNSLLSWRGNNNAGPAS